MFRHNRIIQGAQNAGFMPFVLLYKHLLLFYYNLYNCYNKEEFNFYVFCDVTTCLLIHIRRHFGELFTSIFRVPL